MRTDTSARGNENLYALSSETYTPFVPRTRSRPARAGSEIGGISAVEHTAAAMTAPLFHARNPFIRGYSNRKASMGSSRAAFRAG